MKRTLESVLVLVLVGGVLAGTAFCASAVVGGAIDIFVTVSPNTVVLGLDKELPSQSIRTSR